MNKYLMFFCLVVGALAIYFLILHRGSQEVLKAAPSSTPIPTTSTPTPELSDELKTAPVPNKSLDRPIKPSASGDPTALELIQKTPPIAKLIPKIQDIRQEIEKNPHDTPESLLRFSIELSDKMQIALKSKEASEYLLKELGECADTDLAQTSTAASASCIKNAYDISAAYKDLTPKADEIQNRANPDTQKLYKNMQKLGL